MTGTVSVQESGTSADLLQELKKLARTEVLVGIPAEDASRPNMAGNDINNAELLYIHTHGVRKREMKAEMDESMAQGVTYSKAHALYVKSHGSPMLAIPPRPVLEPAIEANKDVIGKHIAAASTAVLEHNPQQGEAELNKAGMLAVSAARGWFENPANAWPPNSPKTIAKKGSDAPLIDTGEMRKSITYVLRKKE